MRFLSRSLTLKSTHLPEPHESFVQQEIFFLLSAAPPMSIPVAELSRTGSTIGFSAAETTSVRSKRDMDVAAAGWSMGIRSQTESGVVLCRRWGVRQSLRH